MTSRISNRFVMSVSSYKTDVDVPCEIVFAVVFSVLSWVGI